MDEIVCVCTLSIISKANLRAPLTSAVAKKFESFYLQVPHAQLDDGRWCEQEHEAGQTTQQEVRPAGLFTNARILPWRGETAPGVILTRPHSVKDLRGQISPLHKQWHWIGLPSSRRWTSRSRPIHGTSFQRLASANRIRWRATAA